MADRRDFYFRQKVTEAELDDAFAELEAADRLIASDLGFIGVARGLDVAQQTTPNLTVQISGGAAYDQVGQRIATPSTQTLDCSVDEGGLNTAVVTPGNTRTLSIYAEFDRVLSDPRVDGNSATVFFVRAESFQFNVAAGAESAGVPTAPPLRSDQILLADVTLVYGQTQIVDADISEARREWMFRASSAGVTLAAGTVEEALAALAVHIGDNDTGLTSIANLLAAHIANSGAHSAAAITTAGSSAWHDGEANPAADVQSQLDKIVTDLIDPAGSDRIGAAAYVPADGLELSAGSIQDQLRAIASRIGRPTTWRLDLTAFASDNWTFSVSNVALTSQSDDAIVRLPFRLPHGARIDSVSVRIDPGGTRVTNRTGLSINRWDQAGTPEIVRALTLDPGGNNTAHDWIVELTPPHQYDEAFQYMVTVRAGNDLLESGGAHQPDVIKAAWLTLSYP